MAAASLKQGMTMGQWLDQSTNRPGLFVWRRSTPREIFRRNWIALRGLSDVIEAVTDTAFLPSAEMLAATGSRQQEWHERAFQVADRNFGRRVFVRGVVEVSNFCRENCSYCGMRRDNRELGRFRARHDALAELIVHHRPSSVTDINIQAGEDPVAVREIVVPLIRTLRRETSLGISVCLGSLNKPLYAELQRAGATIYILKFEIANAARYAAMSAPGTAVERLDHIRLLAANGWHVSSGFIAGLPGQPISELLSTFDLAMGLPLAGCSVSPFVPGDETPLADAPAADIDLTLNCMAALRLLNPKWIIPAVSALNLADKACGYRRGLRCGANLVTINLTPEKIRADYLLYKRDRFIMTEERILDALNKEGLIPSTQSLAQFYRENESGNDARRETPHENAPRRNGHASAAALASSRGQLGKVDA
jgi:biotin synthase